MAKRHQRPRPITTERVFTNPERNIRLAPLAVTEAEREQIRASAKDRGVSVAVFLRQRALG